MATVSVPMSGYDRTGQRPWDYAVPLNSDEPGNYDVPHFATTNHILGVSQPVMSANSSIGRPAAFQDYSSNGNRSDVDAHNISGKNARLIRKASNLGAREESDESSENARVQGRSKAVAHDNKGRKVSGQKPAVATSEEEQYWIHRDKLAQIESKELEDAGFRLPIVSRAASRAAYSNYDPTDDAQHVSEDAEFHAVYEDEEDMDWELRTPEEVAAEYNGVHGAHVRPTPRAVNSKIPVKKSGTFSSSPTPDRESHRPRSRNVSGQYSGIPEPRNRSRSIASGTRPHTPSVNASASGSSGSEREASPNGIKVANKTGHTPRKSSQTARVVSATKSRVASTSKADSPPKRPGTSSGLHHGRPGTSHRPEGEAPWIATMYKPDPRLPPDQQVLPTHARRLAQAQWEKEGKIGTVYDKDFRLLNTTALEYNPAASPQDERHRSVDEHHEFMDQQMVRLDTGSNGSPTKTTILMNKPSLHELAAGSPRSPSQGPRPGTSGTDHGGYKTMPTIHGPLTSTLSAPPKSVEPMRMQDIDDDAKQKKGCCCIVM